jgi:predicted small lipoprotein YifL
MKKFIPMISVLAVAICITACETKPTAEVNASPDKEIAELKPDYGGFNSQVEWGEQLVRIMDCNVCHTPKIMTEQGPVEDESRLLMGHPSDMPGFDIDLKEIESKGLMVTGDGTAWAGAWGVSFAANLTPDDTGIGTWSEEQFFRAIREGKSKGLESSRALLPPMPWPAYRHMTDDQLRAVFAYLKSLKPISNVVPAPLLPVNGQ